MVRKCCASSCGGLSAKVLFFVISGCTCFCLMTSWKISALEAVQLLSHMDSAIATSRGHRGSPLYAGGLTAGCSAPSHLAIGVGWLAGADWSTLNPPHSWPRQERSQLYGKNDMSAGKPSVWSMAAEILTMPLFLIQVTITQIKLGSKQLEHQFLY